VRYPWASPQIVGLAGTAVFLFALFGARLSIAEEPFISLEIVMANRVVAAAIGCASFAYGTMIAVTIYAPVYFEGVPLGERTGPDAGQAFGCCCGAFLFVAGNGLGTVLPITTVSVQNAVLLAARYGHRRHQFRACARKRADGRALWRDPARRHGRDARRHARVVRRANAEAFTGHFHWMFAAAALSLLLMEERPQRTHAQPKARPVPAE
jgi:hypothetical protein